MIVVSNTSPLRYLVGIDVAHVLPAMFGEVFIPPRVLAELCHPSSPTLVRQWASTPPDWLFIKTPTPSELVLEVDQGEAEAILLAVELHADALLMDDRKGRNAAHAHGVVTVGTLTVLEQAAKRDLIDLPEVLARLRQTNFRVSEQMLRRALDRDENRRKNRRRTE